MLRRSLVAVILLGLCLPAGAQGVSLAEVKAKNGAQLSADDLKQLLPGAKVVNLTTSGNTRRWDNNTNGTLVASSDNKASAGGRNWPTTGNGTWRIGEPQGTFCVSIKWNMTPEDWCRYLFKVGDKYYGFFKLDDSAIGSEFEFKK